MNPSEELREKFLDRHINLLKKKKIAIVLPTDFIKSPQQADIIVVSGYPKRIPYEVIESARIATVNIHSHCFQRIVVGTPLIGL